MTPSLLEELADSLGSGLLEGPLARLRIGWDESRSAWTIPERDAVGKVVGVAIRHRDGAKRMIEGSNQGLTYVPSS